MSNLNQLQNNNAFLQKAFLRCRGDLFYYSTQMGQCESFTSWHEKIWENLNIRWTTQYLNIPAGLTWKPFVSTLFFIFQVNYNVSVPLLGPRRLYSFLDW